MSITINHQTGEIEHSGSGTLKFKGNVSMSAGSTFTRGTGASIDADSVDGKSIEVVSSLPSTPDANTIYLVTG